MQAEVASVVRTHLHIEAVDVERAQRIILSHLKGVGESQEVETEKYGGFQTLVQNELCSGTITLPAGVTAINPNLNEIKARLIAREALQRLHGLGVIVAVGGEIGSNDTIDVSYNTARSKGEQSGVRIRVPVAAYAYRLVTIYHSEAFRLATGDMYLSNIDTTYLPSRAKRCLDECMNAFRHGLYLSAVLNVGAASENIWMELARLVEKSAPTTKLTKALSEKRTVISTIIEETWNALESHRSTELDAVFAVKSEREAFMDHANRLREHRNYAAHVGDAALDEHAFTYEETGMLLLDATRYFDSLVTLYSKFASMP